MKSWTSILIPMLGLVIALAVSMAFVDRPLASLMHEQFHGFSVFPALTHIVDVVLPLAGVGILLMAIAAIAGRKPGSFGRELLVIFIATLVATMIKDQLKFAFGHTWPETWVNGNPSYIRDSVYGFFPFHGGQGWSSFPSGHATLMAALVASAWHSFPRARWAGVAATVVVILGLLGADYHFLSDILAGLALGTALGLGTAALLSREGTNGRS